MFEIFRADSMSEQQDLKSVCAESQPDFAGHHFGIYELRVIDQPERISIQVNG